MVACAERSSAGDPLNRDVLGERAQIREIEAVAEVKQ